MRFDLFVIPFCAGFAYLIIVLMFRYINIINELGSGSWSRILTSIPSRNTLVAVREAVLECLLHRKVFRVNKLLGYMHMSLAFGWFLLILTGKLEASYCTGEFSNEFWLPVFFRFFELYPARTPALQIFNFLMDFLLLFVLSGVALAIFKRFKSSYLGLRSGTKHTTGDQWALVFLWLIFPMRLLAESMTAGYAGNGSFLTQTIGNAMAQVMPLRSAAYAAWWGYSAVLGGFMVVLPYSRYMHIPTEIVLIFLKNWGFKQEESLSGMARLQLFSCSRCGICLDPCQMNQGNSRKTEMVYFLRDLRAGKDMSQMAQDCLLCGRCQQICPVGIDLTHLRLLSRNQAIPSIPAYGTRPIIVPSAAAKHPEILYFAGCMGSLTPGITRSMEKILEESGIHYLFLDKEHSYCCGRPMKLSGSPNEAKALSQQLEKAVLDSGAHTLVTSCPICYKSFKDDYKCNIRILHHSEYIIELITNRLIRVKTGSSRIVYHDPCELGRKSGIYKQPREILSGLGHLLNKGINEQSPCCGGSPGNLSLPVIEREKIQRETALFLNQYKPDVIATACPVCKKSLTGFSGRPVKDIAELVAENLINQNTCSVAGKKSNLAELVEN